VFGCDHQGDDEGQGPPGDLFTWLLAFFADIYDGDGEASAYGCDCLHAEHERVRGQVSRVGEGVFFPELAE